MAEPQPDWPPNTIITGFTFYDAKGEGTRRLPPELKAFIDRGEPPVVFTLGSAEVYAPGCFFTESVKAAEMLKLRAVLLVGDSGPPPVNLPEHIVAAGYAPFSELFSHASVIVHQGGIGTAAQALRSGRPSLVTPRIFDQVDNAARLVRLGTSRTIGRKAYAAKRIAVELKRLTRVDRYQIRAAEAAHRVQEEDGVGTACDAIEQLLHGRVRTLRFAADAH
jgi:UDP:flavonoid glycosyltransferase YjiC (YdhE family)